ncbi:heavy metal-binding domain-containing protein [Enterococcus lemanii]|mgnify:CR=1 FL=1|jgi:hypothetical protein|uniref:Heavy metal-binding domain-containing protein n=1 Tax=Enterococcus lemanii TaxID=1159752 RepID=A0ABV9MXU9_9ENTE|nr:heavy metal-binding domain-containing protein [Enterococcus lemanii]MBM7708932.1 hypothetical protein [Enterococcus lemanii]NLM66724.1 YbjQ family protein [Enterococcus sp.]
MKHHQSINDENPLDKIILSTGNINKPYIVRDIVFVTERVEADLFNPEINPNNLFVNVNRQLKEKAFEYGANAVINCEFNYQQEVIDSRPFLQIFAYGTVVQLVHSTIGS